MITPVIQNPDYSMCTVDCDICKRTSKVYVDHYNVLKESYKFDPRVDVHVKEYSLLICCAYCPRLMLVNASQK